MLEILNQHVPCSTLPPFRAPTLEASEVSHLLLVEQRVVLTHRRCFQCTIHVDGWEGQEHLALGSSPHSHFSIILLLPSIPALVQGPLRLCVEVPPQPTLRSWAQCVTPPPILGELATRRKSLGRRCWDKSLESNGGISRLCQALEGDLGNRRALGLCPSQNISYVTA